MRTFLNFRKFALVAFIAIATVSCSSDDDVTTALPTLYEVAQQNPSLSTFVAAVDHAGMRSTLDGTSQFTILAPTNQAFQEFFLENGYSGVSAVPADAMKQVLYNHLLGASIKKNQFNSGYMKTYATVESVPNAKISLLVESDNDVKFNNTSKIITPNQDARNGTLHVVDKVISIPTIYDHIKNNPNLLTLKNALIRDMASPTFLTLSQNAGPITFFAPRNEAFTAFLAEFNIASLDVVSDSALEQILSYHLVPTGNLLSTSFTNNQVLNTQEGQSLVVTLTGGGKKITDVNDRASNLFFSDIQGSNGVLHVVDQVLKP